MKGNDFDITDSVHLISGNADNEEFITQTIRDIYMLGYNNGFDDAMDIADRILSKMTQL